ncbi:MAG: ABC transporter substrate-binding protein, partial [Alphaproteobacteria bacterium]
MTLRKKLGGLALGALAALFLSSAASAQDKVNFRLDWQIYGTHAPFFLAKEKGFYSAEKLDVTFSEGQGA